MAETREDQIKRAYEDLRTARIEMHDAQLRQDLTSMRVQELQWLIRNDQAIADLDARGYVT